MAGRERTTKISYVAAGINIIHINTELRVAWRRSLEGSLTSQRNEVVLYKILPPVVESVKQVVTSRLKLFTAQLTSNEMHLSTGR
jgi:fructose-bisphosphate aldolase class II